MLEEQAKLEFSNAFEMYRQRPDEKTGKALVKALSAYIVCNPRDIARIGPSLAMLITVRERGHFKKESLKGRILIDAFIWVMERGLGKPLPPKRPGWNDYYMVRWQLTHEQRWADEIHRRTHYTDPHMVGWTANWMAASQRREDPEFNRALCVAEVECGCAGTHLAASTESHSDMR